MCHVAYLGYRQEDRGDLLLWERKVKEGSQMRRGGGGVAGAEECTQRPLPFSLPSSSSLAALTAACFRNETMEDSSCSTLGWDGGEQKRKNNGCSTKEKIVLNSETAFFFHLLISITSGKVGGLLTMSLLGPDSRTTDTTSLCCELKEGRKKVLPKCVNKSAKTFSDTVVARNLLLSNKRLNCI